MDNYPWPYTSIGGFLEWCPSNTYFFADSSSNDILLHSDTSNQNILFGNDSNQTSALNIQHSQIVTSRNILSQSNIYIGSNPDYSESFVCALGNAKFLSNIYVLNNLTIGSSNNTFRLSLIGQSNDLEYGPNMSMFYNSPSDPVYQHINFAHDSIFQCYDLYSSNSQWFSSSPNGNFQITKGSGNLSILTASNIMPGNTITSLQTSLSINSNSFVGFGTVNNVTHRMTLYGTDSDPYGPHVAAYTSVDSNHPIFQQLNWCHDAIIQSFDVYYDQISGGWISSSSNGNFQLSKGFGNLTFLASSNIEPGQFTNSALQIALSINSNSFIGIGSVQNVTHRLTLFGNNEDSMGPHIAAYTANDPVNPVFQQLNWSHDSITQGFDVYYDHQLNDWISSSSNGNFQITKGSGSLSFMSASNITPGTSASNALQIALSINSNSFIGIGTENQVTHRLTLYGNNEDYMGPHIAAYTANDPINPVFQQLNWSHDSITQGFDVYYDHLLNDWISSSSNGNFQITKGSGRLSITSASNITPGTSTSDALQIALSINSNSFIGIGTEDRVTHRLTLYGNNKDILGPHIAAYTSSDSNNPVFQQLNWSHDAITQGFDVYYDHQSNDWISSSSNGNFQITKGSGNLSFTSSSNVAPGASISNASQIALSINSNSFIGIGTRDRVTHRLTLYGNNEDSMGPHIAAYNFTDSNNPVFQQLNWSHDSITQGFDVYYDHLLNDWISSSSNGNFQITKGSGNLSFTSASNVAPGTSMCNALQIALSINSNSFIGIGTEDHVTHRMTLYGADSDPQGPHIAAYTTSDSINPVFQQLNWCHDAIIQSFDVYYDHVSGEWISSSSNGNFQISKGLGNLTFLASSNIEPGKKTNSSLEIALSINSNSFVGIGTIQNITHRMTLYGNDSDQMGPHIAAYTSYDSNHPVFQQLNWSHDDITQAFDIYYDATLNDWISSSSNGNFQIIKNVGNLSFMSASNVVPGASASKSLQIALSINSNSFIGIGTEHPETKLDVYGDSTLRGNINIVNATGNVPVISCGNELNIMGQCFISSGIEIGNNGGIVSQNGNNIYWESSSESNIYILNQFVGIGTSNPLYKLDVNGNMNVSGNITQLSDERYKTNIKPIENALDKVCNLNGYSFSFKGQESQTEFGLIAQQVIEEIPDLVIINNSNEAMSVKYTNIIPFLIESIKELKKEINLLKSRNI